MPAWRLRPATVADRDVIAAVWHASAGLPGVGPAAMPSVGQMRARVDAAFASGWQVTLAAAQDDVLGFVAIKPAEAILDQLFLRPGATGAGIGRALLLHAMAEMPEGFTLFTRIGNSGARRFYEREGLTLLREAVHPQHGDPIVFYSWRGSGSGLPAR